MKKIKYIISIILATFIFISIFSMAHSDEREKDKQEVSGKEKKKINTNPAKFIPSEKINVDSSVSFPVDI